jgi:hypothetical protein
LKIFTAINRMDESKFSIKETDLTENKYPNLILNEIKSKAFCIIFVGLIMDKNLILTVVLSQNMLIGRSKLRLVFHQVPENGVHVPKSVKN